LPVSSSTLTTASCPFTAAHDSGVIPYSEPFEAASTLPESSSTLTTASCPFPAAHHSGVRPSSTFTYTFITFPLSSPGNNLYIIGSEIHKTCCSQYDFA